MKTGLGAITFRVMISLMLVAITSCGVAGQEEAVLDDKGHPIKANSPYLIFNEGSQQSFVISSNRLEPTSICPRDVVLSRFMPPIRIVFELSSDDDVVRVSTKLNIRLERGFSPCEESTYWRVGQKKSRYEDQVVLGGSKSINDSLFTIEASDGYYKLAFDGADIELKEIIRGMLKLTLPRISNHKMEKLSFLRVPI